MAVATNPDVSLVVNLDPEWVPRTVKQALSCSESESCMGVEECELDSL